MSSKSRNRSRGRQGSCTPVAEDDVETRGSGKSRSRKCSKRTKDIQSRVKRMLTYDGEDTQDSFSVQLTAPQNVPDPVPMQIGDTLESTNPSFLPHSENNDPPRVPSVPGFWKDPPPPTTADLVSGLSFSRTNPTRRSQRLLSKTCTSTNSTSFVPSESFGFNFYKPIDRADIPADRLSSHSDYGTSSEKSFRVSKFRHHHRKTRSTCAAVPSSSQSKLGTNDSSKVSVPKVSPNGYLSDIEDELSILSDLSIQDSATWGSDEDLNSQKIGEENNHDEGFLNISNLSSQGNLKVNTVSTEDIFVLIPMDGFELPLDCSKKTFSNPSETPISPFTVRVHPNVNLGSLCFSRGIRIAQGSSVFTLEPFGTTFCALYPAVVSVKLNVRPCPDDEIYVLFCSDVNADLTTSLSHWELMDDKDIRVNIEERRVAFETNRFCTFAIMIRQVIQPETKVIRARAGGKFVFKRVPCVEVNFPKGAVPEDTPVTAQAFFDTEITVREFFEQEAKYGSILRNETLASPIVKFQPHGLRFDPEPVIVQLPIPDFDSIKKDFGDRAKLSIWQSDTGEGEPTQWERLNVQLVPIRLRNGVTIVTFPVKHFSFFKAVWEVISNSLFEAKLGMFFYFVSFAMKCQANMEDYPERKHFGLEVICFNTDKPWPDVQSYKHKVGQSYPKLVRPGRILVELKSRYFEADDEAGEDAQMIKEESDFRGKDFAKQFACKYKEDKEIERGTFGKVIVKRHLHRTKEELLFEFNIQKSGNEADKTSPEITTTDRWSQVALQELGASLFITDGTNWKLLAKHIGFTNKEVKESLKKSPDPFRDMISMYERRGGTPEEFVNALYHVHRQLKGADGNQSPCSSKQSRSSTGSSGRGSLASKGVHKFSEEDSDASACTQISQDSLLSKSRKRSLHSGTGSGGSTKRKKYHYGGPGPPLFSPPPGTDADNDDSTSSSEDGDIPRGEDARSSNNSIAKTTAGSDQSALMRQDRMILEETFLWEMSTHLDNLNWRALGRSLGVQEQVLVNIDHTYKAQGFRECAYQMLRAWKQRQPKQCTFGVLFSKLCKENMNSVAKKMKDISSNDKL